MPRDIARGGGPFGVLIQTGGVLRVAQWNPLVGRRSTAFISSLFDTRFLKQQPVRSPLIFHISFRCIVSALPRSRSSHPLRVSLFPCLSDAPLLRGYEFQLISPLLFLLLSFLSLSLSLYFFHREKGATLRKLATSLTLATWSFVLKLKFRFNSTLVCFTCLHWPRVSVFLCRRFDTPADFRHFFALLNLQRAWF